MGARGDFSKPARNTRTRLASDLALGNHVRRPVVFCLSVTLASSRLLRAFSSFRFLLPVFLSIAPAQLFALEANRTLTQYLHRIWQTPQGLPPAAIRSILHGRDGYMWLGTDRGVLHFDGISFTRIEGAGDTAVQQLVSDTNGNVWGISEGKGVFEYTRNGVQHFSTSNGLPSDFVTGIAAGRRGEMWVASTRGLARIDGSEAQAYPGPSLSALALDRSGDVWAVGERGTLEHWNGSAFEQRRLPLLTAGSTIQTLLFASDGTLWVGTSDGLLHESGQERRITRDDGLAGNTIFTLSQAQDGSILAGTNEGFSRIRGADIESFGPKQGLSQSTVYAIAEDRQGSFWVGTKRGLNQFLDRRTIPLTTSEGLPTNDVGPVLQDGRGVLWVGTLGSGLAHKTAKGFAVENTTDGLSSNVVIALANDPDGGLWAGTDKGLDLLRDGHATRWLRSPVRSLFRDRDGDLWIGTPRGLSVLRAGQMQRVQGSWSSGVSSIAEANRGLIYVADQNGVRVLERSTLHEIRTKRLAIRGAGTLFEYDGSMWVGTSGNGLFLIRDGKLTHFGLADGLFDDDIYGIAADATGRLWMACSKGIFSVNHSDLLKFSAGVLKTISSTPFSPLDGLQTVECKFGVQPAATRLQDGRIAFSTIRGLLIVDPNHMEFKSAPVAVAVEAVVVDGRSLEPGQIRELPPANRNVEFRFTGLSFKAPLRTSFKYVLEGFNRDWIDAGSRREAYYTNLPPGNYRFRVKACDFGAGCESTSTDVRFTLAARFYQRACFWPLCISLAIFATWLTYQLRVQALKKQFNLILSERNRIARELHDTLLQGFSGVTMQMQALCRRIPAEERAAMQEIIGDAASCLTETRRSVANLRGPRNDLATEIAKAAEQTSGLDRSRLKLRLEQIPQTLPPHIEYNLVKIAQEALANAAKHSGARWIEVVLRPTRGKLRLSIEDNGGGLLSTAPEGHYGLIGMRERAAGIGADFQISSEPGVGTTISVALPLHEDAR